ncbi:hypothetical protein KIH41_16985 [Litoribacter ruber]|uniref:hypothetical protein n=1 Tax=Litoribacter ruber TaxID=702568 RepID=UPI001BDA4141|nr:hypothetical protein [Litoribacter ruber]MBT0812985.1 hypothetical protein [Litoribacter ruber]
MVYGLRRVRGFADYGLWAAPRTWLRRLWFMGCAAYVASPIIGFADYWLRRLFGFAGYGLRRLFGVAAYVASLFMGFAVYWLRRLLASPLNGSRLEPGLNTEH